MKFFCTLFFIVATLPLLSAQSDFWNIKNKSGAKSGINYKERVEMINNDMARKGVFLSGKKVELKDVRIEECSGNAQCILTPEMHSKKHAVLVIESNAQDGRNKAIVYLNSPTPIIDAPLLNEIKRALTSLEPIIKENLFPQIGDTVSCDSTLLKAEMRILYNKIQAINAKIASISDIEKKAETLDVNKRKCDELEKDWVQFKEFFEKEKSIRDEKNIFLEKQIIELSDKIKRLEDVINLLKESKKDCPLPVQPVRQYVYKMDLNTEETFENSSVAFSEELSPAEWAQLKRAYAIIEVVVAKTAKCPPKSFSVLADVLTMPQEEMTKRRKQINDYISYRRNLYRPHLDGKTAKEIMDYAEKLYAKMSGLDQRLVNQKAISPEKNTNDFFSIPREKRGMFSQW